MAPHRSQPEPRNAPEHDAQAAHAALVAALRRALGGDVRLIETHISSVLLAADAAYKLKKPVDLGFLDFSTLAARKRYCELELALNRRTAPQLYLEVVPITGSVDAPALGGAAAAIDYAVKMRRFDTEESFDRLLARGALDAPLVDALADRVAAFHAAVEVAPPDSPFGTAEAILSDARDNFAHIERLDAPGSSREALARLRRWTDAEYAALQPAFARRKREGFVRECHGDLHLGNVARVDGVPLPFDCIEFNEDFRWIDVISEIAFTLMDFVDRGAPGLGWRFLNRVLESSGDYAGVAVLRFYLVYRAMVRAKVALIRARQVGADAQAGSSALEDFARHVADAAAFAAPRAPALILTGGVSGSGKTTLAQSLLEALGAVRVRSDIERKRLHGLDASARSGSAPGKGLYTPRATRATYARLAALARELLPAGFPVIADATFLHAAERAPFAQLAREANARCMLLWCDAPLEVLHERIAARAAAGRDASEATLEVLAHQLETLEPPEPDADTVFCDTAQAESLAEARAEIAQRCGGPARGRAG
ncbi:MAG: AAA family ATPase [Burkholderiales bacterium]|nr:AAA family ATPase [Burkholderiales bacterium]